MLLGNTNVTAATKKLAGMQKDMVRSGMPHMLGQKSILAEQYYQPVKIKLVGEQAEPKTRTQLEIENYYKFKKRQLRQKRRQERINKQNKVIDQCSTTEFILLAKINFLMEQQSLLIAHAKDISMQEFLNVSSDDFLDLNQKNKAIEDMEECQASLQKFNMISSLTDNNKHYPSAQRLSSRQTLHRLANRSSNLSNAQVLITAAHEKLNSINKRRRSGASAKLDVIHQHSRAMN